MVQLRDGSEVSSTSKDSGDGRGHSHAKTKAVVVGKSGQREQGSEGSFETHKTGYAVLPPRMRSDITMIKR